MSFQNRGGRPKALNPLALTFSTRLTAEDAKIAHEKIEQSGLKISAALRLLLLNERLPKVVFGGLDIQASQAYQNLQPLQSNLNQVAHWFNQNRVSEISISDARKISVLISKIEQEVRDLRHQIITIQQVKTGE